MVSINIKHSQTDPSLPLYVITCLDNMVNPMGNIVIMPLRFVSDSFAIGWSKEYAASKGWHAWEIFQGENEVYFVNYNLKVERINGKKRN